MKHKHPHHKPANLGPRYPGIVNLPFSNGSGPRHHLGVPCTPQPLHPAGFQSPGQMAIDQNPESK